MEDQPVEYRDLLRARPNHSNIHKIHRWRHVQNSENVIAKVVIIEALVETQIDVATFNKIHDVFDDDWTGMKAGVVYSVKKKRRWLLPETVEENLPEYNIYNLPEKIYSVSIARFHRHKTHCCPPGLAFYNYGFYYYSLNLLADYVKNFGMRKTNGTVFSQKKKKMTNSFVRNLLKTKHGKVDCDEPPRFHLQFQTVEFKTIPNKHNSRVYDYHPSLDHGVWKETVAQPEPYIVRREIPSSGYLEDEEWMISCLENSNGSDENDLSPPRLTLGDFFDVNNIPRRHRKKCDLNEWVVV